MSVCVCMSLNAHVAVAVVSAARSGNHMPLAAGRNKINLKANLIKMHLRAFCGN